MASEFTLRMSVTEHGFVFEVPELYIIAMGTTVAEAASKLCEDLAWVWWEYGAHIDDNLSKDARELGERLRGEMRREQYG